MLFDIIIAFCGWLCSIFLDTLLCCAHAYEHDTKLSKIFVFVCWLLIAFGVTLLWLFLWYGKVNPFCSVGEFLIWAKL